MPSSSPGSKQQKGPHVVKFSPLWCGFNTSFHICHQAVKGQHVTKTLTGNWKIIRWLCGKHLYIYFLTRGWGEGEVLASIIVNICEINWKYIGNTLDGMANIYFLIRGWGEVLASIIGRAGKRKTGVNGGLSPVWSRWNSSQSPVTSH